jgi:hypothetical protein
VLAFIVNIVGILISYSIIRRGQYKAVRDTFAPSYGVIRKKPNESDGYTPQRLGSKVNLAL